MTNRLFGWGAIAASVRGWFGRVAIPAVIVVFLLAQSAVAAETVLITSPAQGATVTGPDVTIALDVGTLRLVPGTQVTSKTDMHVHYLLDVDPSPWLDGKSPIPTGDPSIVHSAATSRTFTDVKPGPHKVTVILSDA